MAVASTIGAGRGGRGRRISTRQRWWKRRSIVGVGFVCALGALALPTSDGGSAPPPLRVDGATVEATGPDGAGASYSVKAFDPDSGAPLSASCDTPPGTSGSGAF